MLFSDIGESCFDRVVGAQLRVPYLVEPPRLNQGDIQCLFRGRYGTPSLRCLRLVPKSYRRHLSRRLVKVPIESATGPNNPLTTYHEIDTSKLRYRCVNSSTQLFWAANVCLCGDAFTTRQRRQLIRRCGESIEAVQSENIADQHIAIRTFCLRWWRSLHASSESLSE